MKKRVLLSFFAFQQNLIKCEVKIYLEFILVAKDIQEVSTFASKKYPLSCLSTLKDVKRHESRNLFYSVICRIIYGKSLFSIYFPHIYSQQPSGYFLKLAVNTMKF